MNDLNRFGLPFRNDDEYSNNGLRGPGFFDKFKSRYLVAVGLYFAMFVVVYFIGSLTINFLSELGSSGVFRVFDWFHNAGFNSRFGLTNLFRLVLLAVFIGWAINRFRGR